MDEAPEEIVPSNPRATGVKRNRIGPRLWRLQVETSMGPGIVVVGSVSLEHSLEVAAPEYKDPVQALGPNRSHPPLGKRVRSWGRIGVLMMFTPSVRKTSSKGPENFESRSRIRNPT